MVDRLLGSCTETDGDGSMDEDRLMIWIQQEIKPRAGAASTWFTHVHYSSPWRNLYRSAIF